MPEDNILDFVEHPLEDSTLETPVAPGEEATQGRGSNRPAPEEEERFTPVDPNSLPDAVKPLYKSLQADYTRKTQALAEARRQVEAEQARLAQQLEPTQQPIQEDWEQYFNPGQEQPAGEQQDSQEAYDPYLERMDRIERMIVEERQQRALQAATLSFQQMCQAAEVDPQQVVQVMQAYGLGLNTRHMQLAINAVKGQSQPQAGSTPPQRAQDAVPASAYTGAPEPVEIPEDAYEDGIFAVHQRMRR